MSNEMIVQKYPYESTRIRIVVSAAGPIMSGIPIGTTPTESSVGIFRSLENSKSYTARTSRTIPPPTRKSLSEIPRKENNHFPVARKRILMMNAVSVASDVSFFLCDSSRFSVNATNNGNTPRTSIATKRGMNARKKVSNILDFSIQILDCANVVYFSKSTLSSFPTMAASMGVWELVRGTVASREVM